LTQARGEAAQEKQMFMSDYVTLERVVNSLRFIVFDRGSNTTGSLTMPLNAIAQP
jgi:hypothetical protein